MVNLLIGEQLVDPAASECDSFMVGRAEELADHLERKLPKYITYLIATATDEYIKQTEKTMIYFGGLLTTGDRMSVPGLQIIFSEGGSKPDMCHAITAIRDDFKRMLPSSNEYMYKLEAIAKRIRVATRTNYHSWQAQTAAAEDLTATVEDINSLWADGLKMKLPISESRKILPHMPCEQSVSSWESSESTKELREDWPKSPFLPLSFGMSIQGSEPNGVSSDSSDEDNEGRGARRVKRTQHKRNRVRATQMVILRWTLDQVHSYLTTVAESTQLAIARKCPQFQKNMDSFVVKVAIVLTNAMKESNYTRYRQSSLSNFFY